MRVKALWSLLVAVSLALTACGGAGDNGTRGDDGQAAQANGRETTIDPKRQEDCRKTIAEIERYPVVWAGDTVLGHALRGCTHTRSALTDSLSMSYGTCTLPSGPGASCTPPVSIISQAPCGMQISDSSVSGSKEVRGVATTVLVDRALVIHARGLTVTIYAPDPEKVAELLVPANAAAAQLGPGDSLNVIDPVNVGLRADAPAGSDTATANGCLEALNAEYTTPEQSECRAAAAGFQDLPLVYPGERVLDYKLTICGPIDSADGERLFGYRYQAYRDCGRADPAVCMFELQLFVMPPCTPDPARGKTTGTGEYRGSPARFRGDRVYVDAPSLKLWLSGGLGDAARWPELAAAFTDALVPANELASALKPGDPLSVIPAKDGASCG